MQKHKRLLCCIQHMVEAETKGLKKKRDRIVKQKPTAKNVCSFYYLSGKIDALESI